MECLPGPDRVRVREVESPSSLGLLAHYARGSDKKLTKRRRVWTLIDGAEGHCSTSSRRTAIDGSGTSSRGHTARRTSALSMRYSIRSIVSLSALRTSARVSGFSHATRRGRRGATTLIAARMTNNDAEQGLFLFDFDGGLDLFVRRFKV